MHQEVGKTNMLCPGIRIPGTQAGCDMQENQGTTVTSGSCTVARILLHRDNDRDGWQNGGSGRCSRLSAGFSDRSAAFCGILPARRSADGLQEGAHMILQSRHE